MLPTVLTSTCTLLLTGPVLHSTPDSSVILGSSSLSSSMVVAIKRFAMTSTFSFSRFQKEIDLAMNPHLVNVCKPIYVVKAAPSYWLVMKFYEKGDLTKIKPVRDLRGSLTKCLDLCKALESMHKEGLVHRDVKTANVLVDDDERALLTDFGSVESAGVHVWKDNEHGPSGGFHKRLMQGTTLLYAAPEIVTLESRNRFDLESDMYAVGITMCEVLTGELPYAHVLKDQPAMNTVMDATYNEQSLLSAICHDRLRPPMDETMFTGSKDTALSKAVEEWKTLIRACWEHDMDKRPTATECVKAIELILKKHFGYVDSEKTRSELAIEIAQSLVGRVVSAILVKTPEDDQRTAALQASAVGTEFRKRVKEFEVKPAPPLEFGAFASSGRRGPDRMEDRHWIGHYALTQGDVISIILVLDGHGGKGCAEFAFRDLGPRVAVGLLAAPAATPLQDEFVYNVLKMSFIDCDALFRLACSTDTSGSTALAVVLLSNELYQGAQKMWIANVGDCRLVLGKKDPQTKHYTAVRLTNDHNADQDVERERVERAGAKITIDANGNRRVEGFIQVTRSLGDAMMKQFGVFAEPEMSVFTFTPGSDDFLIIGTDGLFDYIDDRGVVKQVLATAKEPGLSSKRLGSEAIARGGTDNITAVVVFLKTWDDSGRVDWTV